MKKNGRCVFFFLSPGDDRRGCRRDGPVSFRNVWHFCWTTQISFGAKVMSRENSRRTKKDQCGSTGGGGGGGGTDQKPPRARTPAQAAAAKKRDQVRRQCRRHRLRAGTVVTTRTRVCRRPSVATRLPPRLRVHIATTMRIRLSRCSSVATAATVRPSVIVADRAANVDITAGVDLADIRRQSL